MISAACREHVVRLATPERLAWFEDEMLTAFRGVGLVCAAWAVMPNHYHALVLVERVRELSGALRSLHGRTAREINREDATVGRPVWYRCQDRWMRSERHFYATLNYIHHNPVHHRWSHKWQEWPFSSVHWYLATLGRDWLRGIWREYPLKDYGGKWDPA